MFGQENCKGWIVWKRTVTLWRREGVEPIDRVGTPIDECLDKKTVNVGLYGNEL